MNNAYALMAALLLFPLGTSYGKSLRDLVAENHYSYIPSGQGRFPALVAIPGCSGISSGNPAAEKSNPQLSEDDLLFRRHYRHMAEKLKSESFVVLLVNIHGAEGRLTACADPMDGELMARYINAAVAWASELPFVDSDRLHIIGWSMGGRGVLKWLDGHRSEATSVRSAIVVYPQCKGQRSLSASLPILMLLGGSDDIADPTVCERLADPATIRKQVLVHNYPGARHGFDIEDAPPVRDIGNGKTIGYQKEAADGSWAAILRFLAMHEDR